MNRQDEEANVRIHSFPATACLLMIGSVVAHAQEPKSFEAASIKRNNSGDGGVMMRRLPNGATLVNVPLQMIIVQAYEIQPSQLEGGPSWIFSDRFDIQAKAERELKPPEFRELLRNLLADRFRLVTHTEQKTRPVYALVQAPTQAKTGKLGPKLRKSETDCAALAAGRGGAPPPPPAPSEPIQCGMRMSPVQMTAGGTSMAALANALSRLLDRMVIDRTGLPGTYDFDLAFAPKQGPQGPPPLGAPAPAADPSTIESGAPDLFTAIREQLGLKLESQKAPVDVVVIDKVEPPTEN
jgi:bla regulator protein blaR1